MGDEKKEFYDLIEKLLPLGENEKELNFWAAIFEGLSEEERRDVLANLREELAVLTKLEKVPLDSS